MLEELGVPYFLKMLPFPPRVRAKSFLGENPLGTVPLLEHGGTRLTESAAMCQYLASQFSATSPKGPQLAVAQTDPDFGKYLNFLHMSDATLTFPQAVMLRYTHFEPPERRREDVASAYKAFFLGRLKAIEAALSSGDAETTTGGGEGPFLCAGRFTAADVAVGYALQLGSHLGTEAAYPPAVAAYWSRLQARKAFRRALEVQHWAAIEQGVDPIPAPDIRPFA